MNHFGYDISLFIDCEVCGKVGNDFHHIEARGMGGSKTKDTIENLMCLCRECHINLGDKKQFIEFLKSIHEQRLSMVK
jgi:hypothetical protein